MTASARGSALRAQNGTQHSSTASSAPASGSWTNTSTPSLATSWMRPITLLPRRSARSSMNVSPSTVTFAPLDRTAHGERLLDGPNREELAHADVDAQPGQDQLRVIAEYLGLVRQVSGVDADPAVADKTQPKRQEVPLRTGRPARKATLGQPALARCWCTRHARPAPSRCRASRAMGRCRHRIWQPSRPRYRTRWCARPSRT